MDETGKSFYSNTENIRLLAISKIPAIIPNPAKNDLIMLHFGKLPTGIYSLFIYNQSGQLLHFQKLNHQNQLQVESIHLTQPLLLGNYKLIFYNNEKTMANLNLMIQ